jgi:hypothetical protein
MTSSSIWDLFMFTSREKAISAAPWSGYIGSMWLRRP